VEQGGQSCAEHSAFLGPKAALETEPSWAPGPGSGAGCVQTRVTGAGGLCPLSNVLSGPVFPASPKVSARTQRTMEAWLVKQGLRGREIKAEDSSVEGPKPNRLRRQRPRPEDSQTFPQYSPQFCSGVGGLMVLGSLWSYSPHGIYGWEHEGQSGDSWGLWVPRPQGISAP
jgi:hypothetical protein